MKMLAAVLAGGAVLSACGPVRLGAAVVTQNGRISSETLSAEVSSLNKSLAVYRVTPQFPESQMVLSWLIRFKVRDELAMRYGIKVTPGESQAARVQVAKSVTQSQAPGTAAPPFKKVAVANGLPVNQIEDLYRYFAIQTVIETRLNGGPLPAGGVTQALNTKFLTAECRAAKALDIKVSPQYGRLDYNGYLVVADPSTLAAAQPGATPSPSPSASASAKPQYRPAC